MSRSGMWSGRAWALGLLLAFVLVTPAQGQVQSEDQQRCIRTLNQGFEKMLKAHVGEVRRCLKDAAKDRLTDSLAACVRADAKGRVEKARFKNIDKAFKQCAERPDFGPVDAQILPRGQAVDHHDQTAKDEPQVSKP